MSVSNCDADATNSTSFNSIIYDTRRSWKQRAPNPSILLFAASPWSRPSWRPGNQWGAQMLVAGAQPPTERPTRRARWWRHERYFFFENFSRPNFDFNFLSLQNFPKTAKTFKILNVSYPFHFLCIGGRMKTRYITLQGSELGPQSIALTTRPTSSPKTEPTKS